MLAATDADGVAQPRVGDPRPPAPSTTIAAAARRQAHLHRRRPPPLHDRARLPRRAPGGRGTRRRAPATAAVRLRDDGARQHGRPGARRDADPPRRRRRRPLRRGGVLGGARGALRARRGAAPTRRPRCATPMPPPTFLVAHARRRATLVARLRADVDLDAAIPVRRVRGVEAPRRRGAAGARPRAAPRHPPRPPGDARPARVRQGRARGAGAPPRRTTWCSCCARRAWTSCARSRWPARRCRRRARTSTRSCSRACSCATLAE